MELIKSTSEADLWMEFYFGQPYLHLDFKGVWSKTTYKKMLKSFVQVRQELKEKGYRKLYVGIPYDDELLHFESMFGFQIEGEHQQGYLLSQEL